MRPAQRMEPSYFGRAFQLTATHGCKIWCQRRDSNSQTPVSKTGRYSNSRTLATWCTGEEVRVCKVYHLAIEYHRADHGDAELHVNVFLLEPGKPGSDWVTRLTPMNFYPLSAGAADKVRAGKTLAWMYREDKFWLPWILPTVAKDDPVWHEQVYWHGHIWASANYIVWLGVQRYADGPHKAEFARRSVSLFMRNWNDKRVCCENYNSTDGTCGDEPHYSWGALLNLIGLEAFASSGPDFQPMPTKEVTLTENIVLHNVPFGGKLFKLESHDGHVIATPEVARPSELIPTSNSRLIRRSGGDTRRDSSTRSTRQGALTNTSAQ